jgi:hypothetical protein
VRRGFVVLASLTLVSLAATSCGGAAEAKVSQVQGKDVKPVDTKMLPATMLGLALAPEEVLGSIAPARRSEVEAAGMFSLRSGDLLQATLQVSRLRNDPRFRNPSFRALVVSQIGSSLPHKTRLDDMDVYLTTGARQRVAVWFKDRYFFILSMRDDYKYPKSLIRTALGVTP